MAKRKALTELHVALTASTMRFQQQMKAAGKGLDTFKKRSQTMRSQLTKLRPGFLAVGGAVTAAAGAMAALTARSFGTIDSLAKASDRLGLTTEALAGLRHAAEQTGVQTSTLDMALQRMTRRISEAAMGTGEARDAIRELGLDAQTLAGMSPDEAFRQIADAMNGVAGQGDRVRLAMRLFDSEGVALVNTLRLGSSGLAGMQAEAQRLGIAVGRDAALGVERANDALDRMRKAFTGAANAIAVQLAPVVESLAGKVEAMGISSSEGLSGANQQLGPISRALAYIDDYLHGIKIIGQGIYRMGLLIAQGAARLASILVKGILAPLRLIPGIGDKIDRKFDGIVELVDQMAADADRATQDLLESETGTQKLLRAQSRLRAEVEREREEREAAAAAVNDSLEANTRIVELNRELDPILKSVRRSMESGNMPAFGPPLPDGYERPSSPVLDPIIQPPAPEDPVAGSFRVVDSLANLARGGLQTQGADRPATSSDIQDVSGKMSDLMRHLLGGQVAVALSGVTT